MRMNKALVIGSWLAISFIVTASVLSIFWLLAPYQVTQIEEPINIVNENNEVRIGEPIIQELKIHKPDDDAPTNVSRLILCEDGNLVTLSNLQTLNLPVGKYTLVNDRYILPPKVAVGSRCQFVWRQSYPVNPIRSIQVEWRSETFTVEGSK